MNKDHPHEQNQQLASAAIPLIKLEQPDLKLPKLILAS